MARELIDYSYKTLLLIQCIKAIGKDNITEEEIRSRTKSDRHSLGEWRVNGALPHINAWYEAFNIKPTDKMFLPESKRLKMW